MSKYCSNFYYVVNYFIYRKSFRRSLFGDNIKDISSPIVYPFLNIFSLNSMNLDLLRHNVNASNITLQQDPRVADKNNNIEFKAEGENHEISGRKTR